MYLVGLPKKMYEKTNIYFFSDVIINDVDCFFSNEPLVDYIFFKQVNIIILFQVWILLTI